MAKEKFVEITPLSDNGRKKISYHGDIWIFRKEVPDLKFVRGGPFIGLISKDGKAFVWIAKINDTDFKYRFLS